MADSSERGQGLTWRTPSTNLLSTSAPRIPDAVWEEHKDTILGKYSKQNLPLKEVREQMKTEHDFEPTIRQYVHKLGKWGIGKYRKTSDPSGLASKKSKQPGEGQNRTSPNRNTSGQGSRGSNVVSAEPLSVLRRPLEPTPFQGYTTCFGSNVGLEENIPRYRSLANMLCSSGDSSVFPVYRILCDKGGPLHDVIACLRAAQTPHQAEQARSIMQDRINDTLGDSIDTHGSLSVLVDLQVARTYDHGSDTRNAIGQLEQRILNILANQNGHPRLKWLPPREPTLDLPLFLYLAYAMTRWNQRSNETGDEAEANLNIDDQLCQFVSHQIDGRYSSGSGSVEKITCLASCLRFCSQALSSNPPVPEQLREVPDRYQVYQVAGTLWDRWLTLESYGERSSYAFPLDTLNWVENAQSQLAISPEELLVTVACMITSEACMITSEASIWPRHGSSIVGRASQGVDNLIRLPREAVFRLFLHQLRLNNDPRLLAPQYPIPAAGAVAPEDFHPFRRFIFDSLRLPFEGVDPSVLIYPLVPTSPRDREGIVCRYSVPSPLQDIALRAQYASHPGFDDSRRGRV